MHLRPGLVLAAVLAASPAALAQSSYTVPRTAAGNPDFQGVWATEFMTMLERPAGIEDLVVSPADARAIAARIRGMFPDVLDPQLDWDGVDELVRVRGEYRTSIIVDPEDGHLPYTPAGSALAAQIRLRDARMFDDPEQRPLMERCLGSLGFPPMRSIPIFFPRLIVQTSDHVLIWSEDADGLRIVHLEEKARPEQLRSRAGYSQGRWEGDTLVVRTTHLLADDQARFGIGRPILVSRDTAITERFTRASDTELVYRFTVEDEGLYTRPWTGEFSMTWSDQPVYEYACHEGNYSMPAVLRGGQRHTETK